VSSLEGAKLRAARARFAALAGSRAEVSAALGSIRLRSDQLDAARRARARIAAHGGCLLANDPGAGKTYVALAVAREWRDVLIVVPASLRSTWADAIRRAGVPCTITTHESLSRGRLPQHCGDGIVVDESHRFRSTSRRHAALARIAAGRRMLLLSATPLQNRPRELAAQLAIFLGEAAYQMSSVAMARHIVRSSDSATAELPRVAPPSWLSVGADDGRVLKAILALPPPPRALDSGDGGVLLTISLVRAWASSRAALDSALRRRSRTLVALEQCREEGRMPTRREVRAWTGGDGVQLGFASLLAETSVGREEAGRLADALATERSALDALKRLIEAIEDPDISRANALRELRRTHAGQSIIAFSESAATVGAYFRAMRADAGVGMLTARDARIASGRVSRAELLARFAPVAQDVAPPPERERVTMLLTTDLLSEGVNLQDAAVVVHLDLPWNPARLAQRLGRVRRTGGASVVFSYLMRPPAESALLLRAESRLRDKLAHAEQTIGRGLDVMPCLGPEVDGETGARTERAREDARASDAELRGQIDALLESWTRATPSRSHTMRRAIGARRAPCIVAGVAAEHCGWVAVLDDGRVVAVLHDDARTRPTSPLTDRHVGVARWMDDDPDDLVRALRLADGAARPVAETEGASVRIELEACLASDWAARSCGDAVPIASHRHAIRRRLDSALRDVPRHRRSQAFALAARLRALLDSSMSLGAQRALIAHARVGVAMESSGHPRDDDGLTQIGDAERWIAEALETAEAGVVVAPAQARRSEPAAVIVFGSSVADTQE